MKHFYIALTYAQFSGSARAICGGIMRLIYNGPVAVAPMTHVEVSKFRGGFMDILEDASAILEQRNHSQLRYAVRKLTYRKFPN